MTKSLSDRMKFYQSLETSRRFLPYLPLYARMDGRSFHRFTKAMQRPFDQNLSDVMVTTLHQLMQETQARAGYTQSDEISLLWYPEEPDSELFFGGKVMKMVGILAALTTVIFNAVLAQSPLKAHGDDRPHFDCRVIQMPNREEAANMFLWREMSATRNAIVSAAQAIYSHHALQGKPGNVMQEMMFTKGVNFNDYPLAFKRGVFAVRRLRDGGRRDEMIQSRTEVVTASLPRFGRVSNRVGVLFDYEDVRYDTME